MRFVTNLNLNQNQLINGTFEVLASDPNTGNFDGRLIFNSTEGTIKVYDATTSSWRKMLTNVQMAESDTSDALTINESNGVITITANKATSSADGIMSAEDKAKLDDATASDSHSTLVARDVNGRFQVATPSDPLDAANKGYVDSARSGLDVKQSVRAATTGTVNLATDVQNGSVIDDVTLATGNRILVKDQGIGGAAHPDNGIYIVAASGAPTRATDFDETSEVTSGAFTFVEEGTDNGDSGYVLSTNGTINVGTTPIVFTQFSGTGQITAGDALSKDGSILNVNVHSNSIEVHDDALRIADGAAGAGLSASVGTLSVNIETTGGIEINAYDNLAIKIDPAVDGLATTADGLHLTSDIAGDGLTFTAGQLSRNQIDLSQGSDDTTGTLPIDQGGTSTTSADGARYELAQGNSSGRSTSNPVLARIVYQVIGNNSDTSFDIYHNFGTRHVIAQVYDTATYDTVIADVTRPTTDKINVAFSHAPDNNAYTVVVNGWDDWY